MEFDSENIHYASIKRTLKHRELKTHGGKTEASNCRTACLGWGDRTQFDLNCL